MWLIQQKRSAHAPRPPSSANPVKHSLSLLLFDAPMHDVRMYLCNTHTNTRKNISVWANDCATHYTSKWPLVHSCVPARPRKAQGSNENKYPPSLHCWPNLKRAHCPTCIIARAPIMYYWASALFLNMIAKRSYIRCPLCMCWDIWITR